MRAAPPAYLLALLEEIGLAGAKEIRAAVGRGAISGDVAEFDAPWLDALRRYGLLTPYQAAEVLSGRGLRLRVGPFVLDDRLDWPPYAPCYRAHRVGSPLPVRLTVLQAEGAEAEALCDRFAALAARVKTVYSPYLAPICEAGRDGDRVWAAAPWTDGRPLAQWLLHHGRLPPDAVAEIAAAMLRALETLEAAGVCHGDIRAETALLRDDGSVVLLDPGVRPIVRVREGETRALPAEAWDGIAPELAAGLAEHDAKTDLYACGILWWRLLCGRTPLPGGDAGARRSAARQAAIADVGRFAPETPGNLRGLIGSCTARRRDDRPESAAQAASWIDPPMPDGPQCIAEALARQSAHTAVWPAAGRAGWRFRPRLTSTTVVAACVFLVAMLGSVNMVAHGWRRHAAKPAAAPVSVAAPASRVGQGGMVVAAAHQEPVADAILDWHEPIDAAALNPAAAARIAPKPGGRLTIRIGAAPLRVEQDDVRFENCDFRLAASGKAAGAMVELACCRVEFRRCTFRSEGEGDVPAIRWLGPGGERSPLALSGGRLRLTDCVFRSTEAAIDCRQDDAAMILAMNVLHAGRGPLVRLSHAPRADEPKRLALSLVTLRGGGPLLECRYDAIDAPGELAIEYDSCVFAPRKGEPLVRFLGAASPTPLMAELRLTGQGAILTAKTDVAQWQRADGSTETLDDAAIAIAGLVRGAVRFAGENAADPASSRAVECRAPLMAADAPGVNPVTLPEK